MSDETSKFARYSVDDSWEYAAAWRDKDDGKQYILPIGLLETEPSYYMVRRRKVPSNPWLPVPPPAAETNTAGQ